MVVELGVVVVGLGLRAGLGIALASARALAFVASDSSWASMASARS